MKKVRHLPEDLQALYCSWHGFKLSDNIKKVNRFFKQIEKENKTINYKLNLNF